MADKKEGRIVKITVPVILSFPNLDEARSVKKNGKPTGEPKFSASFEFDPTSDTLKTIKAEALAVAKEANPGRDVAGDFKNKEFAFPWTSGDKLAEKAVKNGKDREWSRGKVVVTARSKYQPILSQLQGGKINEIDGELKPIIKKAFYTGVEVLAELNLQAYDGVGSNPDGVTAYLNKVLSLGRGERLVKGGANSAEVFKDYIGGLSDEDPSGGLDDLDDEIPF